MMKYKKMRKVSQNSQQNNSETVTNENDEEKPKVIYIYIYIYISKINTENYNLGIDIMV